MLGPGLKKLGKELGMKQEKQQLYGEVNGYLVSFFEGPGTKSVFVNIPMEENNFSEKDKIEEFIKTHTDKYKVLTVEIEFHGLLVNMNDTTFGTIERVKEFTFLLLNFLKELNIPGTEVCCICGKPFGEYAPRIVSDSGNIKKMDVACISACEKDAAASQDESKHYLRGFLGAVVGVLIGIIPWIVLYCLGYFAALAGIAIGACAYFGYLLFGGKASKVASWVIGILSFLGVVLAQFLGLSISVGFLLKKNLDKIIVSDIFSLVFNTALTDSDVMESFILDMLLGWVFVGIALIGIIQGINQMSRRAKREIKVLS